MRRTNIAADNTVFVLLSFEGPDPYSMAGGLGVRITNLASNLAQMGFPVHFFFIGDPQRKGEEITNNGKLVYHRWCQWISNYYPNGVYQGENEKLYDFNESIPWFVIEHIVKPAAAQGKLVVVLGEEWHTAEAMCRLSDQLRAKRLRDNVIMFWNANNTFGFDRINWKRLDGVATITTVSRYMKHIMQGMRLNPLVIHNGIPKTLLDRVDICAASRLRNGLGNGPVLAKVARWDPDKRWIEAVEATARLKTGGLKPVLLARGGIEPHGEEVMRRARSLWLKIKDVTTPRQNIEDYIQAVRNVDGADVLNIRFHCPQDFLRIIYYASNAVLANSSHEPFGLVGLETMAAGGIAFTGSTGEDYAIHFQNAIVLETSDPKEIEDHVLYLSQHPEEEGRIRRAARQTAKQYTWDCVIENLVQKLEHQARVQGALSMPASRPVQVRYLEEDEAKHVLDLQNISDFAKTKVA